jgi:predicted TIM-barrel fold metal-dependent hydrolase
MTITTAPQDRAPAKDRAAEAQSIIDVDVHQTVTRDNVKKRLPAYFQTLKIGPPDRPGYMQPHAPLRTDAQGPSGEPAGSYEAVRANLLDRYGVSFAILTGSWSRLSQLPHPDFAAAQAKAYNDALAEDWLDRDDRLRGVVTVTTHDGQTAADEVRRWADDPRMVGVQINSTTQHPVGQRMYWPLFEACVETGRPLCMHPGGEGTGVAHAPTPNGYPTTYLEWHTCLTASYYTQVASLVCEGVFEQFPTLKVLCNEGGYGWVPQLMWRLDKNWKALRTTVPWLKRRPSDVIREHLRFATQPIEEPDHPDHLLQVFDMMDARQTLLFASDYPHWDFDDPHRALPAKLDDELRQRILYTNAAELYGLPATD